MVYRNSYTILRTICVLTIILFLSWKASGQEGVKDSVLLVQQYSNEEYGIAFRYPTNWHLYTTQNRGPFKSMWDRNQLLVCVSPDDPDINFNVRLAKEPPPSPFAENIRPVLSAVSQQLSATIVSFRSLSIAGNEAAEQHHTINRGGTILHQRIVVVSRPAVGFIWTFTAPDQSFGSLDRGLFSQLLSEATFKPPSSIIGALSYTLPDWGSGALFGLVIAIAIGLWIRIRNTKVGQNTR